MKISRTLQIVATLILGLWPVTGHAQTYFYSGPVSGYIDAELTPEGFGEGGFAVIFNTLTESLYYNPVAQTVEESGSVTYGPSSGTFNISSDFLSGPQESGTATLTVGNNGSVSFDQTWNVYNGYTALNLLFPVSGSGIYNGQAFAGSWNIGFTLYTKISAVSPTSLTFSEFGNADGTPMGAEHQGPNPVIPGTDLNVGNDDSTYYYGWSLGPVVAMAVPEPNSIALLVIGLTALAFLRPRLRLRLLCGSVEWQGCNKEKG